ncbi:MAG: hypothetical protein IT267_07985 [Saprospiraceae bacterium]|nr:hypothetical protein [Saprospiraceae bacterium]
MISNNAKLFSFSDFYSQFCNILLNKIKDKKAWPNELSNLLNCSKQTVYRKQNGNYHYTLEEFFSLISHYEIDIAELFRMNITSTPFTVPGVHEPLHSINDYLKRLAGSFKILKSNIPPKITYATRELPIFYYFLNPPLASFKLYVFAKLIWKSEDLVNKCFEVNLLNLDQLQLISTLWFQYSQLRSKEYWSSNILDSTLQQIIFFNESGDLASDHALLIINGLEEVVKRIRTMAVTGTKSPDLHGNFNLYENKILHTGNHVLADSGDDRALILTFDNPNFIATKDSKFIDYTEVWLRTIEDHSYHLGQGSGNHTSIFFNSLNDRIQQVKARLQFKYF